MAKNESYALLGKVMVALTRVEVDNLRLVLDVVEKLTNPTDKFLEELKKVLRGEQPKEETTKEKTIVRRVRVNRTLTPQQALNAYSNLRQCDDRVVTHMPRGKGGEVELVFFKVGRFLSDTELEREYESRGLHPADPFSLAALNAAEPAFADEVPHGTHWRGVDGRWCFATWFCWRDERKVDVNDHDFDWDDFWWYAGIRSN